MGPKKGRRVRKIEVPTDSVHKYKLGDTAADIQWRREERETREREGEAQKQGEEKPLARGGSGRKACKDRQSDTETEAGRGETSQSRYKKGHMTNIYLTGSDEEAIVDFVKDHEELYDKTDEQFKDKARKEGLWERFANSHKLSVKMCKT